MRRAKGFTLIELLIVISIIVLLVAILLPALHRVRTQAKAVGCKSNLRQWGFAFSMHLSDNDCKLSGLVDGKGEVARAVSLFSLYGHNTNDILLCQMVKVLHDRADEPEEWMFQRLYKYGSKFSAWRICDPKGPSVFLQGSYGVNDWLFSISDKLSFNIDIDEMSLDSNNFRDSANVPVLLV